MKLLLQSTILILSAAGLVAEPKLQPNAEQQGKMTPDGVLTDLMAGNERFAKGQLTSQDVPARIKAGTAGQFPKAYILSCVDSRVPVEQVFDQGLGDIFVGRVAGNVESVPQLGSIEFATKVAGVKLVMVLGHEACGAVKGACAGVELGNLTGLLDEIEPAIEAVEGFEKGDRTVENSDFVDAVIEKNVRMTVADLRKRSAVLTELEKEGAIKIVGAVYSLHTGKVTILK